MADTTSFHVEFQGAKLPAHVVEAMESSVRQAVLQHLAALDLRGEYTVSKIPKKEWLGIWIDLRKAEVMAERQTATRTR
jgi:hypothetical protein